MIKFSYKSALGG